MTTDIDAIDAVTARLLGHDPREWEVLRSFSPGTEHMWYCYTWGADFRWFDTEEQARSFQRTGVMPDGPSSKKSSPRRATPFPAA